MLLFNFREADIYEQCTDLWTRGENCVSASSLVSLFRFQLFIEAPTVGYRDGGELSGMQSSHEYSRFLCDDSSESAAHVILHVICVSG